MTIAEEEVLRRNFFFRGRRGDGGPVLIENFGDRINPTPLLDGGNRIIPTPLNDYEERAA